MMITAITTITKSINTLKGVLMTDSIRTGVLSILIIPFPPRSFLVYGPI